MAFQHRAPVCLRRLFADGFPSPLTIIERADCVALRGGEVHLWRVLLDWPAPIVAGLAATLSSDEQERAGRFIRAADAARFVACRGALRSILGRYAGLPPGNCRFVYGAFGKPGLLDSPAGAALQFNVSHSGDWALIAVAQDTPVGVDLEQIRPGVDVHGVGQMAFSAAERELLQTLPEGGGLAAFFDLWTCKEAYLKGVGKGFFGAPQQVTLTAGARSAGSASGDGEEGTGGWFVANLSLVEGYAAAVAVEGQRAGFRYADWLPDGIGAFPQPGCQRP
jgi:4'-phosphopantetheinyl transferase